MTPEREAYLTTIGAKERAVRHALKMAKFSLSETKEWWIKNKFTKPSKINGYKKTVKRQKATVMALRHELQRIKGMDRVVVPSEQYDRRFETYNWYCTKCDSEISVFENYCSECGRRILWRR